MVTTSAYPNCCGALVFQGFSGTDEAVRASFIACMITSNNRMKWSFVLNDRQVQQYPLTLAEAHRVGFVLSASWVNYNHNSQLYEFERCGERLTLNSAAEKIGWVGRVKTPNLGGAVFNGPESLLSQITRETTRHVPNARAAAAAVVELPHQVQRGDYLRILRDTNSHGFRVGSIVMVQGPYPHAGPNGHLFACTGYRHSDDRRPSTAYVTVDQVERVTRIGGREPQLHMYPTRGVIGVGDRVRIQSPASRHNDRELTVTRVVARHYEGDIIVMDGGEDNADPRLNGEVRIVRDRCRKLNPEGPPAWVAEYETVPFREAPVAPAAPDAFIPPFQEINLVDGEEQWRAVRPEAVAQAAPREVRVEVHPDRRCVYTSYHARYRDGRIGAGYVTLADLREANARVRQYVIKRVYNTAPFVADSDVLDL